jgi:hypothetical protein
MENKEDKKFDNLLIGILIATVVAVYGFDLLANITLYQIKDSSKYMEFSSHFTGIHRYVNGMGMILGIGLFLVGLLGVIFGKFFLPKINKNARYGFELNIVKSNTARLIAVLFIIFGIFSFFRDYQNFIYEAGVIKDVLIMQQK